MCGIVGYIGMKEAAPVLLQGLEKLEYRGYDSAGIAVYQNDIFTIKTKGRLHDLKQKIEKMDTSIHGSVGIGHTRWATHGAPSDVNSHPHSSENGRISIVHNGIIENYMELKLFLQQEGRKFVSETDTEIVAQLFDYYYQGDLVDTMIKVIDKIRGAYALGVLCSEHPDEIVAVRKDSPLLVGIGQNENYIASDIPALLEYTRDYYLLEDNEIVLLKKDSIQLFDLNRNEIKKEIFHVTWDVSAAEKDGYDYFMMKEIMEQPEGLRKTILPRIKENEIQLDQIELTAEQVNNINRIHIVACGSAWHASIVGKYIIEKLSRIPVEVDLASEFRYRQPILQKNDLCIIVSQSGETADTLAALREAKKHGVRVLSIVNVVGSSIARESDDVIYTWAGPEIAVATTKGYSTQLSVMYLLALYFGKARKTITEQEMTDYIQKLKKVPDDVQKLLEFEDRIKVLAKQYAHSKDVFVIGRGIDYAAALEGSLKLKEISYIHSEAYAAGELKHGTISLIEYGTLVVAVATQQALFEKLISNIKEVKARGAKVVADEVFYIPKTNEMFTASATVVPLQLLAYYIAVERGCDVDKPRNLAKSVTVE